MRGGPLLSEACLTFEHIQTHPWTICLRDWRPRLESGTKERAVWTSPGSPTPSKHLLEPSAANWRVCSIYFNLSSLYNIVLGNCSCMLSFHTHMIHKMTLEKSVFSLTALSADPEEELECEESDLISVICILTTRCPYIFQTRVEMAVKAL